MAPTRRARPRQPCGTRVRFPTRPVTWLLLLLLLLPLPPPLLLLLSAILRTPVTSPGSANRRSRRGVQGLPAAPRASHGWPLQRLPLLLLLLLLLLQVAGLQSTAVAYAETETKEGSKASRLHARDRDRTPPSSRRLADLPDVTIGANNSGGDVVGAENKGGDQEEAPASLDEEATEAETAAGADEGGGAGGEPLTPEESAEALLADGGPRCFFDGGDVKEPSGEEGGSEQRRLLCLPTLFFLGVSKCGEFWFEWAGSSPALVSELAASAC